MDIVTTIVDRHLSGKISYEAAITEMRDFLNDWGVSTATREDARRSLDFNITMQKLYDHTWEECGRA